MPHSPLTGSSWRVTGVADGHGGVDDVLPETELTASFGTDGDVTGDTGCNRYRGSYVVTGSTIRFSQMITTLRACLSDRAARQEQAFLGAMQSSASYALLGGRLTLSDADSRLRVSLVRSPVDPAP